MRLIKCSMQNFQSYAQLDFDYTNLGLALISGMTKAGKSTILDAPCWVLYGTTSKDSAADDVRSWFAEDKTIGRLAVELPQARLNVTRIRSKRPTENDLFYTLGADLQTEIRGKNADDTQKMLNELLGTDADLFIGGSYLHQFSKADTFFIANAKQSRETLEKIADLTLPVKLAERATEARKSAKKARDISAELKAKLEGKLESAVGSIAATERSLELWTDKHVLNLTELEQKLANYDDDKQNRVYAIVAQCEELQKTIATPESFELRLDHSRRQIKIMEALEVELRTARYDLTMTKTKLSIRKAEYEKLICDNGDTCPTCLGPAQNPNREARQNELIVELDNLLTDEQTQSARVAGLETGLAGKGKAQEGFQTTLRQQGANTALMDRFETLKLTAQTLRSELNPYAAQFEKLKNEVNPFCKQLETQRVTATIVEDQLEACIKDLAEHDRKVSALTWLYDKSSVLRGKLLERTVKQLQDSTNALLERYFDAALRLHLTLKDNDKLEVSLTNGGHKCPYRQTSGGERDLLKLTFNFAYMKAAENKAGIKFSVLMLDETLKGVDKDLKAKAFALLQTLEADYETILVVDHTEEFKNLFHRKFEVVNNNGVSSMLEQDASAV
jgi:DNA repair exonuclease SbcCD ATPase subunit